MKLVINYFVVQYKIPVQIENEDPIFLWLSLKQLVIIIIWIFTLIVALFKHSEMTFVPFLLNLIRQIINSEPKKWVKWVDSFQPIDIFFYKR